MPHNDSLDRYVFDHIDNFRGRAMPEEIPDASSGQNICEKINAPHIFKYFARLVKIAASLPGMTG